MPILLRLLTFCLSAGTVRPALLNSQKFGHTAKNRIFRLAKVFYYLNSRLLG